jgi:hypothetical protein
MAWPITWSACSIAYDMRCMTGLCPSAASHDGASPDLGQVEHLPADHTYDVAVTQITPTTPTDGRDMGDCKNNGVTLGSPPALAFRPPNAA